MDKASKNSALNWAIGIMAFLIVVALLFPEKPFGMEGYMREYYGVVMADMRTGAEGLEAYYADHGAYPPGDVVEYNRRKWRFETEKELKNATRMTTLPKILTTPVSYMNRINPIHTFPDPFHEADGVPLRYVLLNDGWILLSMGPDEDYDIPSAPDFDFSTYQSHLDSIIDFIYDPTNGTVSNGDIMRTNHGVQ